MRSCPRTWHGQRTTDLTTSLKGTNRVPVHPRAFFHLLSQSPADLHYACRACRAHHAWWSAPAPLALLFGSDHSKRHRPVQACSCPVMNLSLYLPPSNSWPGCGFLVRNI